MAVKPVLLRPDEALVGAMDHLAALDGLSRQAWMLDVLDQAVQERGITPAVTSDDVPLPGT